MKTYYVLFEQQGNTEICIAVKAKNEKEAKVKAYTTYVELGSDPSVDTTCPAGLEPGQLIDEDGEELDIPEDEE